MCLRYYEQFLLPKGVTLGGLDGKSWFYDARHPPLQVGPHLGAACPVGPFTGRKAGLTLQARDLPQGWHQVADQCD